MLGAVGISVLWAAGVEFPFAIPPGIPILLVVAGVVALGPWRWAPAVGAFGGLFVTVGFVVSSSVNGTWSNVVGGSGAGVLIGTWIQLSGVLTALVAGVIATRARYRKPA